MESTYAWQDLYTSKSNALEALAEDREKLERRGQFPNAPGDLDKELEDMVKDAALVKALNENTRARMHVSTLPDGKPVDLNPLPSGLYPGEKSNPLDPLGKLASGLGAMSRPSALADSVQTFQKQGEGLEFISKIREVGGLLRIFASNGRLDSKEGGRLGNTLSYIYKNANCKTNWLGKYNSELSKLICPSAKHLFKYYMDGNFMGRSGLKSEIILEGKMFIFASYATTRNPKVEATVQELLEMTETEIDLEISQWQSSMPSIPIVPKGGNRKTRKYKKRRVKKSKTRKGNKSRKHKSKTHKKRKRRRGHKSRKQ